LPALSHVAWGCLILVVSCAPALLQTHPGDFLTRFEHETDPVHRAKLMPRLGDEQFHEIAREISDGNLPEALTILKKYRDEAALCTKELDAKVTDPEKHPGGFKELEISVRQSLRRLDELLVGMTGEDQKPFLEVREELDRMNRHLVRELFPRQPVPEETASKPKGQPK
jgi:hypothetical protein